ncbi:C2 domain-containing protein [Mycena rebaudengoi]|nr:C2 domain-containing protein [Mycena rebaudengoi]
MGKKHPKLRRALKLQFRTNNNGGRSSFAPRPGEQPIVMLRVQVVGCADILAKDRNGYSDPFVTAALPPSPSKYQTPVAKKTLNPTFPAQSATWDFPVFLSTASVLELVVWDKDVLKRDYLGEVGVPVEAWFGDDEQDQELRAKRWEADGNVPFTLPIISSRPGTAAQGSITLKLGFVAPPPPPSNVNQAPLDFDAVYKALRREGRRSVVSAPPLGLAGCATQVRDRQLCRGRASGKLVPAPSFILSSLRAHQGVMGSPCPSQFGPRESMQTRSRWGRELIAADANLRKGKTDACYSNEVGAWGIALYPLAEQARSHGPAYQYLIHLIAMLSEL